MPYCEGEFDVNELSFSLTEKEKRDEFVRSFISSYREFLDDDEISVCQHFENFVSNYLMNNKNPLVIENIENFLKKFNIGGTGLANALRYKTQSTIIIPVVYEDKTKSLEITKPDNENTDNNVDKPSSSETVTPDDSQNTNAAPETGDSFGKDIMAASFAMIICAMGAAYVLMTRKRRQF